MTEVISVRFRNGCKEYYFDPRGLTVPANTDVIVETAQGAEFALCAVGNHLVEDDTVVKPLRGVLRIATDNDRHTAAYNRGREKEAFEVCKKKIQQHKLEMKLVRVECSFDGSKILFFFTADGRVDFRELVKDLAGVFRARIELRQIGVRDEAKMIGGLGICGRPFCCAQFMDEFLPVSIKMAKTQSLSLNPTKISGTCGRLMCCLKYEQDAYEDAIKRMPKNDSFVLTPDGTGNVSEVNVLKETVNVKLDDRLEGPRCYHNCEVCVLRSGKGSREGIVIPDKRPERYVEPLVEEELPTITLVSDFDPDAFSAETEPKRRRSRGGRGRRRSEGGAAQETAAAPEKTEKQDKPAPGEKPRREGGSRRRRGGRRSGGAGGTGSTSAPKVAPKPAPKTAPKAAPKAAAAPKPPKAAGEGQPSGGEKRRRSHRPRRRSGGGKPSGGAEA